MIDSIDLNLVNGQNENSLRNSVPNFMITGCDLDLNGLERLMQPNKYYSPIYLRMIFQQFINPVKHCYPKLNYNYDDCLKRHQKEKAAGWDKVIKCIFVPIMAQIVEIFTTLLLSF